MKQRPKFQPLKYYIVVGFRASCLVLNEIYKVNIYQKHVKLIYHPIWDPHFSQSTIEAFSRVGATSFSFE